MGFFIIKKQEIKSSKTVKKEKKKLPKTTVKTKKISKKAVKEEKKETEKEEKTGNNLTAKQELFCQLYSTNMDYYGNGTQAYAVAYDKDLKDKGENKVAQVNASKLLRNAKVLSRIRELQNSFLSDEMIDKELSFVALQRDDLSAKMRAIGEYNKLKQRITDKSEVELKFDPLEYFEEINKRKKG